MTDKKPKAKPKCIKCDKELTISEEDLCSICKPDWRITKKSRVLKKKKKEFTLR